MTTRRAPVDAVFDHLGAWIAGMSLDDVPEPARETARRAIVDYVGVTFAAREDRLTEILDEYRAVAPEGPATIISRGETSGPETAAFLNGAIGHALDFDDSNEALGGHPTMVLFPAALATAQSIGADGRAVLEGYIAGFEVAARLGRGLNYTHYERGWHPTATLGSFGATAAAARIRGLNAEQCAAALSICASLASGLKANFGTMAKPIQAGRAAQNGVFAAHLASLGATANPSAFESVQGFGAVYQGLETVDFERLLAPMAPPWELQLSGLNVKRFPCCASTHGAIEAAVDLRQQLGPDHSAIESIRIWTHPRRLRHTNRPVVTNGFQGKFSVQYTVAVALQRGYVGLNDFSEKSIADAVNKELLARIIAEEMPEERWNPAHHYAAEVEATLADGSTVRARTEKPRGVGPEQVLSLEQLTEKFLDCMRAGSVPDVRSMELLETLLTMERFTADELGGALF